MYTILHNLSFNDYLFIIGEIEKQQKLLEFLEQPKESQAVFELLNHLLKVRTIP